MSKKPSPTEVQVEVVTEVAPTTAYVVAVHGELLHLFTNVVFTKDPKKVTIDGFLQAQLDAGKLQVVTP